LLATVASAAELTLTGTWVGEKPSIPSGSTVVLAFYDMDRTFCCGGPAAALAGLNNLREALAGRKDVVLIAVDVTAGATVETATAHATEHRTTGVPLLVDAARATATGQSLEIEMVMNYLVLKPDGTRETAFSPNIVRKQLGL
jgi:peroxiredoxin